jgi:competence protein ComGC
MAQAGYCDQCGTNVWLTPDGGCPQGHAAEHITGVYEASAPGQAQTPTPTQAYPTAAPAVPVAPPAEKKSRKGLVIAIVAVIMVLLLCCCSVLAAIAIPAFVQSKDDAQARACFSNERALEGAAQTFIADSNGVSPQSLTELVPEYVPTLPSCPKSGTYTMDPADASVSCSVHGHF